MRILVIRPRHQALITAARLNGLGHETLVAPLFEIMTSGAALPHGAYDAVLATSARAIQDLATMPASPHDRGTLLRTKIFVAGERTAEAARRAGFSDVAEPCAAGHDLAARVMEAFVAPGRLLYLAGQDRKPDLEAALAAAGHEVATHIVYVARATKQLPIAIGEALRAEKLDAVLHYSRRSAQVFVDLAEREGLATSAARLTHVCISCDAAAPLRTYAQVRIADTPDEAGIFLALEAGGDA